ncbi:VOC family protein [Elizabethkingia anophelis]|uniref:VOC family protein n=1 Tax=Elizabethkingia anophelis TaxID=1117645 RepID=UPI00136DBAA9|nr:VOC family protein [Elizabethkingia anophelis]MYZ59121.1 VOC family protein [Elizabethkingia anophelis]
MIKFGYMILYVNDVVKSVDFYETSFGFKRKFISSGNDYAELETGSTTLAFASKQLGNANLKNGFLESTVMNKPFGIEIALTTDDVKGTIESFVKNGAVLVEEPVIKPWGQSIAYIRDIDGFLIEICTPVQTG